MSNRFCIWVLPNNLRVSSQIAANLLRDTMFDVLYLNIQRGLDWLIEDLSLGAPYDQFIDQIGKLKLLHEPLSQWEYHVKPILLALRGLKLRRPGMRIICYKSPRFTEFSTKAAEKIAILLFRMYSTDKIDLSEWRNLISNITDETSKALKDEACYITETFERGLSALCLSDFCGRHFLKELSEKSVNANLRYIFLPYHFTPLEALTRIAARKWLRGEEISSDEFIKLIRLHAKFVREYVLTSRDYDEAYFKWVQDKQFMNILRDKPVLIGH